MALLLRQKKVGDHIYISLSLGMICSLMSLDYLLNPALKNDAHISDEISSHLTLPSVDGADAGGDASHVRSRRRLPKRLQDESASGSDVVSEEDNEEEESSDEELRAMANIRRRRQRPAVQAAPPKVRLRTGARAAAAVQQATPPKLSIKYSAGTAAAAQPLPASGAGRSGRGHNKWRLDDDKDDDLAEEEAGMQPARQPARATSLKLKLKFGESGGRIPQVDGADDTEEEDALHAEAPRAQLDDLDAVAEDSVQRTPPAEASAVAHDTRDGASLNVPSSAPEAADTSGPAKAVAGLANGDAAAARKQEALDGPLKERGADAPAGTPPELNGREEYRPQAQTTRAEVAHDLGGSSDAPKSAANSKGCNGEAAEVEQAPLSEAAPAAEALTAHGGSTGCDTPHSAAAGPPAAPAPADAEELPADQPEAEHGVELPSTREAGPEDGVAVKGEEARQRGPRLLSEQERAGIPALVHALRRWLRELGGRAATNMEDPEVTILLCTFDISTTLYQHSDIQIFLIICVVSHANSASMYQ